jgi:hypothetical protein
MDRSSASKAAMCEELLCGTLLTVICLQVHQEHMHTNVSSGGLAAAHPSKADCHLTAESSSRPLDQASAYFERLN